MIHIDEDRQKLLQVLSAILVEIRSSKDIELANALADIFHNLPVQIGYGADLEKIYDGLRASAKRNGQSNYLESLLRHYG